MEISWGEREERGERREERGEPISTRARAPELVIVTMPDLEMKLLVRSKLNDHVIVGLATYCYVSQYKYKYVLTSPYSRG